MAQQLRDAASDGTALTDGQPSGVRDGDVYAFNDPEAIFNGDILHNREFLFQVATADRFATRLMTMTQAEGVPLDESLPSIEIFRLTLEVFIAAIIRWPHLITFDTQRSAPGWTEADAAEMGLSPAKIKPKRVREIPTLMGCQGAMSDGSDCPDLRVYGHKYCPAHEKLARAEMRGRE